MAIASFDISCDKVPRKSSCSINSSKGGKSCRLLKINFADRSLSSASKRDKTKKMNPISPYLTGDRVQLLSRVTEKRLVHKKTTDFVSSFPLAVNIYKAYSGEFKPSKKSSKKVKKSVLTLPNDPAPIPQLCTVSDMNDSEYCEKLNEDRKQKVIKKRTPIQNNKKARVREKDFEFYDRDAQYCSQLNINLDSSSTDMMKNFNGDGKRVSNKKKVPPPFNKEPTGNNHLNDVWAVLRNINKFQFRPSPPMSEESIIPIKKKVKKRRANHKDTRVIEACRTEEFAYITSYELNEKSPRSYSPSSSIDRITVIDKKKNEFNKIYEDFEKRLLKTHDFLKDSNNTKNRNSKNKIQCRNVKNNVKAISNIGTKENKQLIPLKKKKKMNFKLPADQQSKSEPTNSSENRDSLIDEEDVLSHKTANDSVFPVNGSLTYSDYLGPTNKAELPDKMKNEVMQAKDKLVEESSSQSKDISNILSEEGVQESSVNSIVPKRLTDPQKRKTRLVATMPSSCMIPKLTQTEIKRRLANIKFPVVILGKDQVSSGIKVMDNDPLQFNGLEDHIWPFMIEWSENTMKDPRHHNRTCNSYLSDTYPNKSRKATTEIDANKQAIPKNKQFTNNNDSVVNKKKAEPKRPTPFPEVSDKLAQSSKKQKSIVQLKDKMLNFLYKKTSSRNNINENHQNDESNGKKSAKVFNKVDATTETQIKPVMLLTDVPKGRAFQGPFSTLGTNKKLQSYAYPWAKAKWASDFIENVMKKVRSGVYYSQDQKHVDHKNQIDLKEVSVQAGSVCESSDATQTRESDLDLTSEVTIITKQSNLTSIPGFDNTLPLLEIKTLNMNQIAVKHCMTNVVVQFDITVPVKSDQSTTSLCSQSLPLIPIEITESHTKIYKCKTTVLNAMLPAEICTILPRMISSIMDPNINLNRPAALCPSKTDSCLSTITELTRYENGDSLSIIALSVNMSPEMKHMLEGSFTNRICSCSEKAIENKTSFTIIYNHDLAWELLPKVTLKDLSQYELSPLFVELDNKKYSRPQISIKESNKLVSDVTSIQPTCTSDTSMEVYTGSNRRWSSALQPYNLSGIIENILSSHNLHINLNVTSYVDMLKLQYDGKNIKINVSLTNTKGVQKDMSVTVKNLNIDSLFKAFPKISNKRDIHNQSINTPLKCIEYINTTIASKSENIEGNQVIIGNKIKRRGFYKLYRKCKSTTNIPVGEKSANTPLSKVSTIDDFFQILGSKKILCSVFDGYAAKKILSSLMEIKNWITEINPKQALLILLLTNKKDTPNLVRFRPILLQGIAVNRITRATELDMEIEVIERENLNKYPQYEGISYLPESVTNYDNLMEELYWIAKTTASDYQRTFDESSERLLKSLVEKRKKLNPSYLRVMARYVGLGLLKSPTKK